VKETTKKPPTRANRGQIRATRHQPVINEIAELGFLGFWWVKSLILLKALSGDIEEGGDTAVFQDASQRKAINCSGVSSGGAFLPRT